MDQLTSMRAFVKVVEAGGFAPAGRALELSTTMVSKHVASLEARLGVPLLARTTRKVSTTEAGQRFYARCLEILQSVDEAEREVGREGQEPVGCLRITAPVELGNLHVAPLVPALLRRHPRMTVAIDFSNRVVDLVEEGFDAAVRVAQALDTGLKGRQLATSQLVLVASGDYLAAHGEPDAPEALAGHDTLSFSLGMGRDWTFVDADTRRTVAVRPRLLSSSSDALRTAALAGAGIALLPTFLVGGDLAAGRLRRVLPRTSLGALRIFVVHPHRRTHPARLRAFIDALVARFGDAPQRDPFLPTEQGGGVADAG